jgi:hypothetical protein
VQTCRNLRSVGPLSRMRQLRRLNLTAGTTVSDGDLADLFNLPHLRSIALDLTVKNNNVTPEDVEEFNRRSAEP